MSVRSSGSGMARAAVVLAAALLVSGCAGGAETADADEARDLQALTLAESDLPAGSQYYRVPDPTAYGQQLIDAITNTTFDPAECKRPREEQARIESTAVQAAVHAQTPTGTLYVAAVTDGEGETPDLVDRMVFGPCAIVTTERTVDGVVVDSTVTETTHADAPPGLNVDEVVVYRQRVETTSRLAGDTTTPTTLFRSVGYAWTGSHRVMVEQTSTEAPDRTREEFDALLRAAVAKTR
ncbi:hypothetical protein [Prescottella subtropica]|uniref:hypothetical protein n=1 Tax=Prescottella subtropica TaxID=2545757 RepID=UPI0010F85A66|nr:hypothetical protein [Prescottella subtropica]